MKSYYGRLTRALFQFGFIQLILILFLISNQPIRADHCSPPSHDGAFQFRLHRQELDRWGSSGEDRNNQTWRREELLGWRKFSLTLPRTFITSRRHLTTEIVLYFIFVFFTSASVLHRVFQALFWTVSWLNGECFNPDQIFIEVWFSVKPSPPFTHQKKYNNSCRINRCWFIHSYIWKAVNRRNITDTEYNIYQSYICRTPPAGKL